jgi:hypothetical protein
MWIIADKPTQSNARLHGYVDHNARRVEIGRQPSEVAHQSEWDTLTQFGKRLHLAFLWDRLTHKAGRAP